MYLSVKHCWNDKSTNQIYGRFCNNTCIAAKTFQEHVVTRISVEHSPRLFINQHDVIIPRPSYKPPLRYSPLRRRPYHICSKPVGLREEHFVITYVTWPWYLYQTRVCTNMYVTINRFKVWFLFWRICLVLIKKWSQLPSCNIICPHV